MPEFEALVEGAREWFAAGKSEASAGRLWVAYEAFRHAAELAAKALLYRTTGATPPKNHAVAGLLSKEGLVPRDVDARKLHQLLSQYTRGTYGFDQTVHRTDVEDAKRIAERMLRAL